MRSGFVKYFDGSLGTWVQMPSIRKTPLLAYFAGEHQHQGAIFLHTWNDGKLDGLVVENNTVYWNPPEAAPALRNDAVFQDEGFFKNNRIYSTSPQMIASNQSLRLDGNQ